MKLDCLSREQLLAQLAGIASEREAIEAHLADCASCRQRAMHLVLERQLPSAPTPRRARMRPAWLPLAALAGALVLGVAVYYRQPAHTGTQFRAGDLGTLGLAVHTTDARGVLQLAWTPHPEAIGYRIRCYAGGDVAWLDQELAVPRLNLSAPQWQTAPAGSRCRADAQMPAGDWVIGSEGMLSP